MNVHYSRGLCFWCRSKWFKMYTSTNYQYGNYSRFHVQLKGKLHVVKTKRGWVSTVPQWIGRNIISPRVLCAHGAKLTVMYVGDFHTLKCCWSFLVLTLQYRAFVAHPFWYRSKLWSTAYKKLEMLQLHRLPSTVCTFTTPSLLQAQETILVWSSSVQVSEVIFCRRSTESDE